MIDTLTDRMKLSKYRHVPTFAIPGMTPGLQTGRLGPNNGAKTRGIVSHFFSIGTLIGRARFLTL